MCKVSVIIPVYGVEKYIERCAVSLFEQTLDDIEYLFVNDCTQDRSIEILKSVLERYPNRIPHTKIVDMPINSGQAAVRKVGMELATGEYVIHCDSDDWLDVTAYEKLYENAVVNRADIVFCDFYKSDGVNHVLKYRDINLRSRDDVFKSVAQQAAWSLCGALVRRSIYSQNRIVFPENNNGEDFALFFQLTYYSKSFSKVDEPLYYYFTNPASISNIRSEDGYIARFNQLVGNTELIVGFVNSYNEGAKFHDLIMCYKLYCRAMISHLTKHRKYKDLWNTTYPELTYFKVMSNRVIPIRTRLHYLAVKMNVYNYLR